MKKWFKSIGLAILGLAGLVITIPLIYVGITLIRANGGLPVWDATVEIPGLESNIEILRDVNGIPHVFALSERDMFFAQGFSHAQDRLWQMMVTRQQLSGRLSEWLGSVALGSDRLHRALRIADTANVDIKLLSHEDLVLVTAYADGVNAYLKSSLYRRPPEMVVLHIEPEPWNPHDSIMLLRGVYLTLINAGKEIQAQRLALHGAHPRATEAITELPYANPPIVEEGEVDSVSVAAVKENSYSDSWVVSGDYTVSGKPLLANDPQLPSTLPNFWYLMHLAFGKSNLVGGTLPGIPSVAVGRNNRVAWGVTNGMVDQMDMMLLHGHKELTDRYRRQETDDWQQFDTHEEVYEIRFGEPFRELRRSTPVGTIIPSEVLVSPVSTEPDALVEARVPYLDGDASLAALLSLNRAQNVSAAIEALSSFAGPSLNFTLADVDGDIAYVSAGHYAIREGDAATVIDYAPRDSSEWKTIPYVENPRSISPPSGRFVSANQPSAGDGYPYYLSDYWAAPFRAMRIHELLNEYPKHDVNSFLSMQRDTYSVPARIIVPKLLASAPQNPTGIEAEMIQTLENWNYRFTLDSAGATVFLTWLHVFYEQLARDEIGELLWSQFQYEPLPPAAIQVLEGVNTQWCQVVGVNELADCGSIVRESLAIAAGRLETQLGPSPASWTWNDATATVHPHLVFSSLPILGPMFSRTFNFPGGPDTLMIQHVDASNAPNFTQSLFCSSLQAIYDMAQLDRSLFMLSTGQSGHFRSPYYDNLMPKFAAGERFEIPTEKAAIKPLARLELHQVN